MNFELIFFIAVSIVAVASAILMVTRPNPVMSVLFLIVNFFCLALLYLTLHAQFIAIIQILVYAGAIMVLFLFVIMLLNLGQEEKLFSKQNKYLKMIAVGLPILASLEIIAGISLVPKRAPTLGNDALQIGTIESIGKVLFRAYLVPFEITSMLLLAAMVGVIVLAKKKFE
ncbi:MAG: NADH-quinone oxidoreductase subunit J [Bacteroidota bacterium]